MRHEPLSRAKAKGFAPALDARSYREASEFETLGCPLPTIGGVESRDVAGTRASAARRWCAVNLRK
jgi:hypothetical protein